MYELSLHGVSGARYISDHLHYTLTLDSRRC
jgi:hypothetical protein